MPTPPRAACRLFDTLVPLQQGLVDRLAARPVPFASAGGGMSFTDGADVRHGPWRSYFVGLAGGVAAAEQDVLWPNQVRPARPP
jgi:hypothetical protein